MFLNKHLASLTLSEIRSLARFQAADCEFQINRRSGYERLAYIHQEHPHGVRIGSKADPEVAAAKLSCHRWWGRKLRHIAAASRENLAARAGEVGAPTGQHHCHPRTLAWFKAMDTANQRWLEKQWLMVDGKPTKTMWELVEPQQWHRFCELYAMLKTIEKMATNDGLAWSMVTLTLPPEYHPNPASGNNSYGDHTTEEAHEAMLTAWQRVRAILHKSELTRPGVGNLFGYRFVETHKDGCPHWHVLIFHRPEALDAIEAAFRQHFPGDRQLHIVTGDPEKGSAANYCVKYVLKYARGGAGRVELIEPEQPSELDEDLADLSEADRVSAKLRAHRIRSFQAFGLGLGLTKWRALRRLRTAPEGSELITKAWQAARQNDIEAFLRHYAPQLRIYGEETTTEYGEAAIRPLGVTDGTAYVQTFGLHRVGAVDPETGEVTVISKGPRGERADALQEPDPPPIVEDWDEILALM